MKKKRHDDACSYITNQEKSIVPTVKRLVHMPRVSSMTNVYNYMHWWSRRGVLGRHLFIHSTTTKHGKSQDIFHTHTHTNWRRKKNMNSNQMKWYLIVSNEPPQVMASYWWRTGHIMRVSLLMEKSTAMGSSTLQGQIANTQDSSSTGKCMATALCSIMMGVYMRDSGTRIRNRVSTFCLLLCMWLLF